MPMKYFYYLILSFCCIACHSVSDSEKATTYLNRARTCIEETHYNQAKILLDSIHQTYPREVTVRRMAKVLLDSISVIENQRTLAYCDSMLPLMQAEVAVALKNFRKEEDSAYLDQARYVHKLLRTENNALRCYLQAKVGEKGNIFLKSMYCGRPIEHNSLELHSSELFVKAPGDNLHAFDIDNTHCETLTFAQEEALSVLHFIEEHVQEKIKVLLVGSNSFYPYMLMETERKALTESYALSILLSDYERLMQERRRADIRKSQSLKRLSNSTETQE